MISSLISRLVVLVFGTLYPAYCSYKAVKSKNVREYVKWMMYWIVFALFTSAETFADIFISWIPFYYEIKVVFVIWLLSPYTKGSSFLYRKFVHPTLVKRESEIDDMISKAKEQGYSAVLTLGSRGISYATNLALQAATKGPLMIEQFRRSQSMSDVGSGKITEVDDDGEPLLYDNDLALTKSRQQKSGRGRSDLDSDEGEEATHCENDRMSALPSDEDMEQLLLQNQLRNLQNQRNSRSISRTPSRENSFSSRTPRENSFSSTPSREHSFSRDAPPPAHPSPAHPSPAHPSPPRPQNRLSASQNQPPPLKQEEMLERFSKLTPDEQQRFLQNKNSVLAEMMAQDDEVSAPEAQEAAPPPAPVHRPVPSPRSSVEKKLPRPKAAPPSLPEGNPGGQKLFRLTAVPKGIRKRASAKETKL